MDTERLSWPAYALALAETAKLRSKDKWVQCGAVVLRHNHSVASVGYNGNPSGIDIDFEDRDARRPYSIHAEMNCLRYCSPGEGKLIASSLSPCPDCLKNICAYGIKEVFFKDVYDKGEISFEIAKKFGIEMIQLDANN